MPVTNSFTGLAQDGNRWATAGNWADGAPGLGQNYTIGSQFSGPAYVLMGGDGVSSTFITAFNRYISLDIIGSSGGAGGTLLLNGDANVNVGNNDGMDIYGNASLQGTGSVNLSGFASFITTSATSLVTLDDTTVKIFGEGAICSNGYLAYTNEKSAVIDGDVLNGAFTIQGFAAAGNTFVNFGAIEATDGGGVYLWQSVIDNTGGGTISAVGASGATASGVMFGDGAVIEGGTISNSAGGVLQGEGASTFDSTVSAVHISAGSDVHSASGTTWSLTLKGALDNKGSLNVTTLTGAGAASLSGGGSFYGGRFTTITGAGGAASTFTNLNNTIVGTLNVVGGGGMSFVNAAAGVIEAQLNSSNTENTLQITGFGGANPSFANKGTLEGALGGNLDLKATTIDSTGGQIKAIGANGGVTLDDGLVLIGGTLSATGGGVFVGRGSSTLDSSISQIHVTAGTTLQTASGDSWTVTLKGALDNKGTLSGVSLLTASGAATLYGGGVVALGDARYQVISGTTGLTSTLTNANDTIQGTTTISSNGTMTFVNGVAGVINANNGGGLFIKQFGGGSPTFTNYGLMESTSNGPLSIQTAIVNYGNIQAAAGSGLEFSGAVTGTGKIQLLYASGSGQSNLALVGDWSDANLLLGAGTINGAGHTLTNKATIDANVAGQTLNEIYAAVVNSGLLEADAGTLRINDAVTGAGSALVTDGGSMYFASTFNEFVTFQGAGLLSLNQVYSGILTGFGVGDKLDLNNIGYSAGEHVVWRGTAAGVQTFALQNSGNAVLETFRLRGDYSQGFFSVASNNGVAEITVNHAAVSPPATADFNGDLTSDILWTNNASHKIQTWTMQSGGLTSSLTGPPLNAGYTLAGVGDFSGDGTADLLLYNAATGSVWEWDMAGGAFSKLHGLGTEPLSANFSIAGVGDFNGDGNADILWVNNTTQQTMIWEERADTRIGVTTMASPGAGWSVLGTGDFNADGVTDVLWTNASTGATLDWRMSGGMVKSTSSLGAIASGSTFAGVGDFDGKGADEVLFQTASGGLAAWRIVNGANVGTLSLAAGLPSGFAVAKVGDFNGDGISDVLLYNSSTGAVDVGLVSGGAIAAWTSVGAQIAAQWKLAG